MKKNWCGLVQIPLISKIMFIIVSKKLKRQRPWDLPSQKAKTMDSRNRHISIDLIVLITTTTGLKEILVYWDNFKTQEGCKRGEGVFTSSLQRRPCHKLVNKRYSSMLGSWYKARREHLVESIIIWGKWSEQNKHNNQSVTQGKQKEEN